MAFPILGPSMETHYSIAQIEALERMTRINLLTSALGYRPACLVGSIDSEERLNLAMCSAILHLGASPALIGLISRPDDVARHSLENIRDSGSYTINLVHSGITEQAHYTSAKFEKGVSEFDACGLTAEFKDEHPAPYVLESRVKLGLTLERIVDIEENGTRLIIGKLEHLYFPEGIQEDEGHLNHNAAHSVAVSDLGGYHRGIELARYPLAEASGVPIHLNSPTARPDQVVFDEKEQRYNAAILPYATDQGAPSITPNDLTLWKNTGASKISHHLKTRYDEIRAQFEEMKALYSWNEMVYQAKFSFEPVLGQVYHLYRDKEEQLFLSMIPPDSWKREHLGSFRLNADQIWEKV